MHTPCCGVWVQRPHLSPDAFPAKAAVRDQVRGSQPLTWDTWVVPSSSHVRTASQMDNSFTTTPLFSKT